VSLANHTDIARKIASHGLHKTVVGTSYTNSLNFAANNLIMERQMTEDRRQRTEDRGQKTEDRRQRTDDRRQRTEDISVN
jgi:hypothetical protein